jgi:hypothetical protein
MTNSAALPASMGSTDRWENEGGLTHSPETQSRDDLRAEVKRYGITPVQLTVFDWGGYRYTNAKDAIAAAKRLADSAWPKQLDQPPAVTAAIRTFLSRFWVDSRHQKGKRADA